MHRTDQGRGRPADQHSGRQRTAGIARPRATARAAGAGEDGAMTIARRSRGTPRIANRLLRRVRDYSQVRADGTIAAGVAAEALAFEGVDDQGLDALDRNLLRTIATVYGGGPAGVEALAATLNEEAQTLEEVVEPYLLKIGFLTRTPAGRRITPAALEHLDLAVGERNHAREQGQLL